MSAALDASGRRRGGSQARCDEGRVGRGPASCASASGCWSRRTTEFGHRFLADEARAAGQAMSDRTAWGIASSNGWWSVFGKKSRGKGKKAGPPVHDDRVQDAGLGPGGRTPTPRSAGPGGGPRRPRRSPAPWPTRIQLAPPRDPEYKGRVERSNQYLETSFLPGRQFASPAYFPSRCPSGVPHSTPPPSQPWRGSRTHPPYGRRDGCRPRLRRLRPPGRPWRGPDPGTAASDDVTVPLKAEPRDGAVRPRGPRHRVGPSRAVEVAA